VPPKVAATQPAADASDADGAESDDELVHPVSPAAAAEDSAEHCHWEDGVIASWLQGIDHGELLHPVEEGDGEEEALAGPSCSRAAAAGLPGKSMPLPSPYSSLLYN
jgi:hypothetical protein